jgi:hypothetical protein
MFILFLTIFLCVLSNDPNEGTAGILYDDTKQFENCLSEEVEETAGVCIRPYPPFGGKVIWKFNPGQEWRVITENSKWISASAGEQSVDAIYKNSWGCDVYKILDHCTATVHSDGKIDCCCNALVSGIKGKCVKGHFSIIGNHPPRDGC